MFPGRNVVAFRRGFAGGVLQGLNRKKWQLLGLNAGFESINFHETATTGQGTDSEEV